MDFQSFIQSSGFTIVIAILLIIIIGGFVWLGVSVSKNKKKKQMQKTVELNRNVLVEATKKRQEALSNTMQFERSSLLKANEEIKKEKAKQETTADPNLKAVQKRLEATQTLSMSDIREAQKQAKPQGLAHLTPKDDAEVVNDLTSVKYDGFEQSSDIQPTPVSKPLESNTAYSAAMQTSSSPISSINKSNYILTPHGIKYLDENGKVIEDKKDEEVVPSDTTMPTSSLIATPTHTEVASSLLEKAPTDTVEDVVVSAASVIVTEPVEETVVSAASLVEPVEEVNEETIVSAASLVEPVEEVNEETVVSAASLVEPVEDIVAENVLAQKDEFILSMEETLKNAAEFASMVGNSEVNDLEFDDAVSSIFTVEDFEDVEEEEELVLEPVFINDFDDDFEDELNNIDDTPGFDFAVEDESELLLSSLDEEEIDEDDLILTFMNDPMIEDENADFESSLDDLENTEFLFDNVNSIEIDDEELSEHEITEFLFETSNEEEVVEDKDVDGEVVFISEGLSNDDLRELFENSYFENDAEVMSLDSVVESSVLVELADELYDEIELEEEVVAANEEFDEISEFEFVEETVEGVDTLNEILDEYFEVLDLDVLAQDYHEASENVDIVLEENIIDSLEHEEFDVSNVTDYIKQFSYINNLITNEEKKDVVVEDVSLCFNDKETVFNDEGDIYISYKELRRNAFDTKTFEVNEELQALSSNILSRDVEDKKVHVENDVASELEGLNPFDFLEKLREF